MTRRGAAVASKMLDADGRERVSIDTTAKRNFARACLETWTAREGRDKTWLLRAARSIDVPAEIVEATRLSLMSRKHRSDVDD